MRSMQPARRGDEDVDAAGHGLDLRPLADAADRPAAHAQSAGCGHRSRKLSAICSASSRVGVSTRHAAAAGRAWACPATSRCRIGSAKAAVLPVPVWAHAEQVAAGEHVRESPAPGSASGCSYFSAVSARWIGSMRARSEKRVVKMMILSVIEGRTQPLAVASWRFCPGCLKIRSDTGPRCYACPRARPKAV